MTHENAKHLTGTAEQELCDKLDRLMHSYTDRGFCGHCIARMIVTHTLGQAYHDLGSDMTREIIEGNLASWRTWNLSGMTIPRGRTDGRPTLCQAPLGPNPPSPSGARAVLPHLQGHGPAERR